MLTGRAWTYGDHLDTDAIIPARYLVSSDPDELARHCMEGIDPGFAGGVQAGDILVAGENFGCGSSREHAALAIQAAGVGCVVVASAARIFYRNAINIGLPVLISPDAVNGCSSGDRLCIDLAAGKIENRTRGTIHPSEAFPAFIVALIESGGLVPFARARWIGRRSPQG
jgi:3-isopropylmalate/(R)-2-methylmalate dehydratase small subunit